MQVDIKDNSKEVKKEFVKAVIRALTRCGMEAEGYAKDLAPVGTPESTGIPGYIGGTLRNSITYAISGEAPPITSCSDNAGNTKGTYTGKAPDDNGNKISVYIGSNVEYAAYVELGTSRQRHAQPYLKPAVADHAQTYRNIINDELKNA